MGRVSARVSRVLPLVFVAAFVILSLAVPAVASAVEFNVTAVADEADDNIGNGVCHAAGRGVHATGGDRRVERLPESKT